MDQIKYLLRGVSIEQFATPFDPHTDNFTVNLNIPIKTNYAERTFAVGADIQFLVEDKPFIIVVLFCHYEIDSESWIKLSGNNTKDVVLPKDFIRNLVAIAISTSRGALCARTEKTPFSKYFVPLINIEPDDGEDLVIHAE